MKDGCRSWAPAEIFVGGGKPKKGPQHGEKSIKKAPQNEKKEAPIRRKSSKKAPNIAKICPPLRRLSCRYN